MRPTGIRTNLLRRRRVRITYQRIHAICVDDDDKHLLILACPLRGVDCPVARRQHRIGLSLSRNHPLLADSISSELLSGVCVCLFFFFSVARQCFMPTGTSVLDGPHPCGVVGDNSPRPNHRNNSNHADIGWAARDTQGPIGRVPRLRVQLDIEAHTSHWPVVVQQPDGSRRRDRSGIYPDDGETATAAMLFGTLRHALLPLPIVRCQWHA